MKWLGRIYGGQKKKKHERMTRQGRQEGAEEEKLMDKTNN